LIIGCDYSYGAGYRQKSKLRCSILVLKSSMKGWGNCARDLGTSRIQFMQIGSVNSMLKHMDLVDFKGSSDYTFYARKGQVITEELVQDAKKYLKYKKILISYIKHENKKDPDFYKDLHINLKELDELFTKLRSFFINKRLS
jgi:hypothetical protein